MADEQNPKFKKLASASDNFSDEQEGNDDISEAEVEDVKPEDSASAGDPQDVFKAKKKGWNYYLPLLILAGLIIIIFIALFTLNSSDDVSQDSKPHDNDKSTPLKPVPDKQKKNNPKKNNKQGKRKKQNNEVILLPSQRKKNKQKGNDKNRQYNNPPLDSPSNQKANIIDRAARELHNNRPPNYLRSREAAFARYLQRRLDYPVATDLPKDTVNVLEVNIIDFLGKVILTHEEPDSLAPSVKIIRVWPEKDITDYND